MNCKNCGASLSSGQQFCQNCGTPVSNNASRGDGFSSNSADSSYWGGPIPSVSGFAHPIINEPSGSAFNTTSAMQGVNQSVVNNAIVEPSDFNGFSGNNNSNNFDFAKQQNSGEQLNNASLQMNFANLDNNNFQQDSGISFGDMPMPDENPKKKFPWIPIAIGLVVVMVVGVVVFPLINKNTFQTFENDDYRLEYNGNWTLDQEQQKMTLFYSDNDSRFILNAVSTFDSLNFAVEDDDDKKTLYDAFYKAWSNVDGGKLTGGTDTFLYLNNNAMYARVDYEMLDRDNIGSFYVVVNISKNKVLSFMSYCTDDNFEKIDSDIMEMLKGMTYKSEADSSSYNTFDAGHIKEYMSLGYMEYKVPDCWVLDEQRTQSVSYKSNIFVFKDGTSLLDVKAVTPYNSTANVTGTTYEAMKQTIINNYGAVKEEKTVTVKGKVWYVIVTPDYTSGGKSYHNEIYFTLSANNRNLYYLEAYVSNDTSTNKANYFNESINYILESATLHKVDE